MTRKEMLSIIGEFVEQLIEDVVDKPTELSQFISYGSVKDNFKTSFHFISEGTKFAMFLRHSELGGHFYLQLEVDNPIKDCRDVLLTLDLYPEALSDFAKDVTKDVKDKIHTYLENEENVE